MRVSFSVGPVPVMTLYRARGLVATASAGRLSSLLGRVGQEFHARDLELALAGEPFA
jgi:hypothetical protein